MVQMTYGGDSSGRSTWVRVGTWSTCDPNVRLLQDRHDRLLTPMAASENEERVLLLSTSSPVPLCRSFAEQGRTGGVFMYASDALLVYLGSFVIDREAVTWQGGF